MEHSSTSTLIRDDGIDDDLDVTFEHSGDLDASDLPSAFPVEPRSRPRRLFSEGRIVFVLAFGCYLTVAILLAFKYGSMTGDAFSRMANGFYIIYSRDPHLAAVGFVWTPLQSIADMTLLLANPLWPDLSHYNMAGSLVSSLAMAGGAYQILSSLREWGVGRSPRLVLTGLFAVSPMILLYGGNGMSEGLYMFTLIAATRYLLRWMRQGDLRSLAYAAIAVGFGYLARNEAAGAALLGGVIVGVVSYSRGQGNWLGRSKTALADLIIFAIPGFVAAAGWAVTSYVITGQFFGQFSSIYGNSVQVQNAHNPPFDGRVLFLLHASSALAPLLPVIVIAAVSVAIARRDPRILAPLALLGGAMGFDVLAYLDNTVFSWFRFYIATVPIQVLLVGSLVAALQNRRVPATAGAVTGDGAGTRDNGSGARAGMTLVAICLVLVVMIPAAFTTAKGMLNPSIAREESQDLGFIFRAHPSKADRQWQDRRPQIVAIGSYFAGLHLPDGDVVVDNSAGCIPEVITTMSQPRLFVIPNDRDFQRILADPITFHVHYLLEPNPAQVPVSATNLQYPRLWDAGSGFTKMVHQIPARGTCPEFRLFHVVQHSNTVS